MPLTLHETGAPALVRQPVVLGQIEGFPMTVEQVCLIDGEWERLLLIFPGNPNIKVPVWTNTPTRPNQLTLWGQGSLTACSGFSMEQLLAQAAQRLIPVEMEDRCGPGVFGFMFVPAICTAIPTPPPPEPPPPLPPPIEPPPPEPPPAPILCTSDADCPSGIDCVGGQCVEAAPPPVPAPEPPPEPTAGNLFPLLAVLGGVGLLLLSSSEPVRARLGLRAGV